MSEPIVVLDNIDKRFSQSSDMVERFFQRIGIMKEKPTIHAVQSVSLSLNKGEVLGIVGESGCGKSTLGRIIANIINPSSGKRYFKQTPISKLSVKEKIKIQMIFQDPYSSLNPKKRIVDTISEPVLVHGLCDKKEIDDYVSSQLSLAGLNPDYRFRYPHEFSGGQRQRIGIARALAVNPEVLICDEAVSALDVSIQAQIINLLISLRYDCALSYFFISHDLSVIRHLSDRVAVMYFGRVVELAHVNELFKHPAHPYTQTLLSQMPKLEREKKQFLTVDGEIPNPYSPPKGCHFHPRCPYATARCRQESPELIEISPNHYSACHLNT